MLSVCLRVNRSGLYKAILTRREKQEVDAERVSPKELNLASAGATEHQTAPPRTYRYDLITLTRAQTQRQGKQSPALTRGTNAATPQAIRQEPY